MDDEEYYVDLEVSNLHESFENKIQISFSIPSGGSTNSVVFFAIDGFRLAIEHIYINA